MQGLLAQDWRLLAFEHLDGVSLDPNGCGRGITSDHIWK